MIPPATVQQILDAAQVEDVVEEFVNLRKRGANLLGLCPFHNEKTPSFTVSPAKNLYKCFGCGKGGGAVNFLMEHEHLSYPEALRHLAKKYNIEIEEVQKDDEQIKEEQHRQSLLLINEMAKEYFVEQLATDEGRAIGLSYYKHRGLLETTIKTYELGYAPKGGKVFQNYAIEKGYKLESLQQLGLVSQSGYDFYRERVIFPFHSISGKVIGFGARQLTDNKKSPKYLNSPESEIYNKRKTLYGLYQAKGEIRKKDVCILVEGYTDVLSLYQNGVKNVVASSGTSLTTEQARLIKRFAPDVVVLYDGDAAGQNAAVRGLDIFLEADVNVKVVMLPEGHDPDSYIREVGATAFEEYIAHEAKDFILMRAFDIQSATQGDPVNKSIQIRELLTSLAKIREQMKRSLYLKEIAVILDVAEASLIKETNRAVHNDINKRKKQANRTQASAPSTADYINRDIQEDHSQEPTIAVKKESYPERNIVRVLLQFGEKEYDDESTVAGHLVSCVYPYLGFFRGDVYRRIYDIYYEYHQRDDVPSLDHFVQIEDEEIRQLALEYSMPKHEYHPWEKKNIFLQTQKNYEDNHQAECAAVLARYLEYVAETQIAAIQEKIRETEDEDMQKILLTALLKAQAERTPIVNNRGKVVL